MIEGVFDRFFFFRARKYKTKTVRGVSLVPDLSLMAARDERGLEPRLPAVKLRDILIFS